jgi:hypothetical protein
MERVVSPEVPVYVADRLREVITPVDTQSLLSDGLYSTPACLPAMLFTVMSRL